VSAPSRRVRAQRATPDRFLSVLMRMLPLDARPRVKAVFDLGAELRRAERGNTAPVSSAGVFLDMVEQVANEWTLLARLLNERAAPQARAERSEAAS
jgi:hypothetical protein